MLYLVSWFPGNNFWGLSTSEKCSFFVPLIILGFITRGIPPPPSWIYLTTINVRDKPGGSSLYHLAAILATLSSTAAIEHRICQLVHRTGKRCLMASTGHIICRGSAGQVVSSRDPFHVHRRPCNATSMWWIEINVKRKKNWNVHPDLSSSAIRL